MNGERLLLDTVYVQALLNRRDEYHAQAKAILPRVRAAAEVWVTEAVLVSESLPSLSYRRRYGEGYGIDSPSRLDFS